MNVRYKRTPSDELVADLKPGSWLATLLKPRVVAGLAVDVQFRERDEVHLYCGQTRLVNAKRLRSGAVRVTAAKSYRVRWASTGLFRKWSPGAPGLGQALDLYMRFVAPAPRWTAKEGRVQARWLSAVGPHQPWHVIDREAVLGYPDQAAAASAMDVPVVHKLEATLAQLQSTGGWARPKSLLGGNELDQLGVDRDGNVVLVELKWGNAADVYWAPAQVVRYAMQWRPAIAAVLPDLQELVDKKVALGLLPAGLPRLRAEVRPVVAWGAVQPTAEKLRRLRIVKKAVQPFVSGAAGSLQTWTLGRKAIVVP